MEPKVQYLFKQLQCSTRSCGVNPYLVIPTLLSCLSIVLPYNESYHANLTMSAANLTMRAANLTMSTANLNSRLVTCIVDDKVQSVSDD